ncbi:MAG: ATP-grasp domain-containing protein [Deltaproteobacteria bacterium]|nr:ATP-grasp domain-containing protein [Deltaproteobacteria bacterium]
MHWLVERGVFGSGVDLTAAIERAGHHAISWQDEWWDTAGWPRLGEEPVIFHGSLGNAARIRRELSWRPGSFCDTDAFRCSAWYDRARPWLLNSEWEIMPAHQLVAEPPDHDAVFVRPDSPLKPFSGRVLERSRISLAALDFGFYFDDPALPVVVAPARQVQREWRYVVVDGEVVAGSAYEADGRRALPDDPTGRPWAFAKAVASDLEPPESVYVLDVCESGGELRLLELNPFSGADLYACDADDVVRTVSVAARRLAQG